VLFPPEGDLLRPSELSAGPRLLLQTCGRCYACFFAIAGCATGSFSPLNITGIYSSDHAGQKTQSLPLHSHLGFLSFFCLWITGDFEMLFHVLSGLTLTELNN
jgi:hypothetical protein